jgi:hypothetical protein
MDIKENFITKVADTFSGIIAEETFDRITFLGLGKAFTDAKRRSCLEAQQKEDEDLIESLLNQFDDVDQFIARPLLKNQLQYWYNTEAFGSSTSNISKSVTMKIGAGIIKYIIRLRGIIGIQPMSSPVGLVYSMVYKYVEKAHGENKLGLEVISQAVEAGTRKLKSQHDLDLESELLQVVTAEIGTELIDFVISDLMKLAKYNEVEQLTLDGNIGYMSDQIQSLFLHINKSAINIASSNKRGAGNFIITTPLGLSLLQTAKLGLKFTPTVGKPDLVNFGHVGYIGTGDDINLSMFKVYCTLSDSLSDSTDNKTRFLIGYKGGNGEIDVGYIHCPYIAFVPGNTTVDEYTFQPIQKLCTRYGTAIRLYKEEDQVDEYEEIVRNDYNLHMSLSDSRNYYRLIELDTGFEKLE